jgi:large-conductance mechanosensitive channel
MNIKHTTTDTPPKLPSERSFGLFFTGVFLLAGGYVLYKAVSTILAGALLFVAALFLIITIVSPSLLVPLNRAWFSLGILLGKIVNPLVLGVVFFIVITPVAMVMRLAGRDALRMRKKSVNSYWIERSPIGPDSQSFKNQF